MAVAGWFAQAIIQSSIDTLASSAVEKFRRNIAMNDALLSLNTSLSKANAILDIGHKMKSETHLNCLLKQLKEAAYDAGDVVDDLKYEELKKRVDGDHSNILSSSFEFASDLLNDATSKVREVQKRLDEIAAAIEQVVSISSTVGPKEPAETYRVREESSSFLLDPEVFGREKDQKRLNELLLKEDEGSQSGNNLFVPVPVISLVGMGGIGKTTLAQWAYSELEEKFEEKIWICASDPFDVNRLTREIVQSVDNNKEYSPLTKLDKLQEIVKKQLAQKRFLLVIDDVWNEDRRKWETFYAPLKLGAPGSKILVTTRSRNVASIVNSKYAMPLDGLPEDKFYSLFNKCAFGNEDPKKYGRMEAIGRNIAARLKGSPLAAKTLGSLLNSHLNEDYWKNIQDSEIWDLQQGDNDIMPVLKLSFDNLSPRLKPCFAYCSLIPKGYYFEKDIIVQMWMAHDFIVPEANLRMEDVGYRYFDDLFSRCLFEKSPFGYGRYVMHDLLHDLAQSISKDECVRLEYGKPQDIPSTVRHLSVCVPYPELNITDICKHRKLRTLFIDVKFNVVELEELLSDLTYVRVMELRGSIKKFPDSIGELKQLRYLDISRTEIDNFPESLCFLYNLQRFKVGCIAPYPKRMENLVNLRELPGGDTFICQVADVGKLIHLQELDTLDVRKESGHKMEELQKLTELGGRLCIKHLESIDGKEEAMKAKLKDKKYLRQLSLFWAFDRPTDLRIDISDEQVLEGLQPHPNLEELSIINYSGIKYPSWLESQLLSNLITVRLIGCRNMEKLMDMPELEKWSGVYGSQFFSCLTELDIEECPKLRNLPCLPPSLVELRLIKAGLDALLPVPVVSSWVSQESSGSSRQNASLLRSVYIKSCPNLKTVEEWLLPEQLPALYSITIIDCAELTSLTPIDRFKDFTCLERLTLKDCPKLTTSAAVQAAGEDNLLFPSSLLRLELGYCGDLERPLLLGLRGATFLKWLTIRGSSYRHIISLPGEFFHHLTTLTFLEVEGLTELRTLESLQHFTSLYTLIITNCPQLKALPEDGLPTTLKNLDLYNCHPELKERCQKDTGDDWPKIAHIPYIRFDG